MRKILLSAVLLGLAAPVWAETKEFTIPPHMGISPEEFKQIQADVAEKKKEQEPLLKKLNEQAKQTADCRMDAAKLVTPTNVQAGIKACDEEARAAIEKLMPTNQPSPSMMVSGTISGTLVSGSIISGSMLTVSGMVPAAPAEASATAPAASK